MEMLQRPSEKYLTLIVMCLKLFSQIFKQFTYILLYYQVLSLVDLAFGIKYVSLVSTILDKYVRNVICLMYVWNIEYRKGEIKKDLVYKFGNNYRDSLLRVLGRGGHNERVRISI